ncbi:MAG: hypothetical protein B7Z35_11430 [Hydrogenophilales bacterium 12-61-10]|nr:MAG: hypothetical protein B7Z35_11430 [Hydrogenophilales bacterium 12-61-10]OYX26450.1 MAG: hypothetical protein B7Z03_14770 [Hydrogenophilales bacterium 32-62-9]
MFDRVEVDVIDMSLKIRVVPNLVFPETTLPDALFTLASLAWAASGRGGQGPGKACLGALPANGIIGIT